MKMIETPITYKPLSKELIENICEFIKSLLNGEKYIASVEHQDCAYYMQQEYIAPSGQERYVIEIKRKNGAFVKMLDFNENRYLSYNGINGYHLSGFNARDWKPIIRHEILGWY